MLFGLDSGCLQIEHRDWSNHEWNATVELYSVRAGKHECPVFPTLKAETKVMNASALNCFGACSSTSASNFCLLCSGWCLVGSGKAKRIGKQRLAENQVL